MGGCASKPKEKAAPAKSRSRKVPISPEQPTYVVMQEEEEKNNEGEIHMEEPLVNLSEAKPEQEEAAVNETRSVEAEVLVSELFDDAIFDKTVEETKDSEVETAETEHKEGIAKAEAVKEKKQSGEIMQVDDDAPPRSSDAPLVTM